MEKCKYDLDTLRHSASHIMAQAVLEIYPGTKLAIGPSIEDGFYYDFDCDAMITTDDLAKIEKKMNEIINKNYVFERSELPKPAAKKLFLEKEQPYKLELIDDIADGAVSIYKNGDFVDLCRGPHIKSTGDLKVFKLLSVAGAYWRGSEKNKMLQRIYGTAFFSKEDLDKFLYLIEEAKKRDHRKLGKELDFFSMDERVGPGLVIYHHKGALLRSIIEDYEKKEHLKRGYKFIIGPHILKSDVWKQSGHYDYYKENMFFFEIDGQEYGIKPMNCPAHMIVYGSKTRSYKDLPLRFFELGNVYRNEKSGVLHGLLRVRGFTQDDAHIFCLPDQLNDEISGIIKFVVDTMKDFGFSDYHVELSTRPEKSIGSDEDWKKATEALVNALELMHIKYEIQEGEGAFYGPKIDIKLKDALGREWQCATIQCDFALPERFDLTYVGSDGKLYRPVMLHRVLLGSMERFIGALLENYGGALPVWLSSVQVVVVPINDGLCDYAKQIADRLLSEDIRVEVNSENESLNYKVRQAQLEKIPYVLVVGQKELEANTICVRERNSKTQQVLKIDEFIEILKVKIKRKE